MKTVLNQAEIWQLSAESFHTEEYRTTYSEALDFVLRNKDISILDTAGGTGFPTLDLYDRGYRNISVTDGDEHLSTALQERFNSLQLKANVIQSRWHELSAKIDKQFDAVINVDNSLVYMDGWLGGDMAEGKEGATARLRLALENFYAATKEGGLTVVGLGKHYVPTVTRTQREFSSSRNGETFDIKWHAEYDWNKRVNEWTTIVTSESYKGEFLRKSYLITKHELVELMQSVGYKRVHVLEPDCTRDDLVIGIK